MQKIEVLTTFGVVCMLWPCNVVADYIVKQLVYIYIYMHIIC